MLKSLARTFGAVAILSMAGFPAQAKAASPLADESFPIGTSGAVCEAQGVMLGDARTSIEDRKWVLICRDVDRPIGTAYSWLGVNDPASRLGAGRDSALECDAPSEIEGGGLLRSCVEAQTGLKWNSYSTVSDGRLTIVEGYAAFDGALRMALANIDQNRIIDGDVQVVTTGGQSLAQARSAIDGGAQLIGQGYRSNNSGDYTGAEEFFRPELLRSDDAATLAERRHEANINRGLQLSNLGRYEEADRLFEAARELGLQDPIQGRLLRNFEAISALNQGLFFQVSEILDRPVPSPSDFRMGTGQGVDIAPELAEGLNIGLAAGLTDPVGQETRLTRDERADIIDAQARQLRGSLLRLQGRNSEAMAELSGARSDILAVKEGRVLSVTRLRAQVLSEMALAQEALGGDDQAQSLFAEALALMELRYPDSPSVNAAKARLASFLVRNGQRERAYGLYGEIVESVVGQRGALVGVENQLRPYFTMLIEDIPQNPERVSQLFVASQLARRPGSAQTLGELSRRLSAGDSEASDLFRRATSIDRELSRLNLQINQARLDAEAGLENPALPEWQERRQRLERSQIALFDALAAYPAYRSVANDYVSADEMRALLGPGEGYLKLTRLGDDIFAVYLSADRSAGWKVDLGTEDLADLVGILRDSISLTLGGVTATYPFDVDASRELYEAVFAPVSADLATLDHLIFEPDGAMLQLPVNLLAVNQESVDRYHSRVDDGGDEYDFRGVAWLGRDKAISTALSPASFRDARNAPASKASLAYLGLGQNTPLGDESSSAYTRSSLLRSGEPGCQIPLGAWNQPIPDAELRLASSVFGDERSSVLTGDAFTDTAVEERDNLDEYRIVHFATHGLVTAPNPGCPASPALLTSFGGEGSDGLLQFADIFDLNFDADLVILSACDTASMAGLDVTRQAGLETGGGQALDGLVRAFIGAGSRQVIASHWPAPEEFDATGRLFSGFFDNVSGQNLGQAMVSAQRVLMDDAATSHPFYWSGFALIGDGAHAMSPAS